MASAGAAVFLILPLLVGQMVDLRGLDESAAGMMASVYFAAYFLASASAYLWNRKISAATAGLLGYALMALGLAIPAAVTGIVPLAIGFLLGGAGGGVLYVVGVSVISESSSVNRDFGIMLFCQQLLAAVLYLTIPSVVGPSDGIVR